MFLKRLMYICHQKFQNTIKEWGIFLRNYQTCYIFQNKEITLLSTANETNLLNMSLPSFKFLSNHFQMETKLLLSNSSLFHKWWPTKSKWSQQWLHSSCCWWHGAFTDFSFSSLFKWFDKHLVMSNELSDMQR